MDVKNKLDYYTMPFNKIDKSELIKLCVDNKSLELKLNNFKNDFKIRLEYGETAVYPSFIVYDEEKSLDIGSSIIVVKNNVIPQGTTILAYKRADEFLDNKGIRVSQSKETKLQFELIRSGGSYFKLAVYKVTLGIKKLIKALRKKT